MKVSYPVIYFPGNPTEEAAVPVGSLVVKSGESEVKLKSASGIESVATSSTVSSAVAAITIKDWQASTAVALNEVRRAPATAGTVELGDLIRSDSARTTAATFDATEAGNWTEFAPDIVTSVAGKTGAVALAKADVSLGSVDNTSDAGKPVSTAQATAIGLKADSSTLAAHTGSSANPHAVTKAQVGLGSADNTADNAKPISTAQQTALDAKQATLVSGTNIKTVGGQSLVGSGNITTSADLDGGLDTTATNEGLATTGSPTVDTTTVPGETIVRWTGAGTFTPPTGVTNVRVLVVAGGGGGGVGVGGGGGGGGVIASSSVPVSGSVTVTVGLGGPGLAGDGAGTSGGNSVFGANTAIGGGGGGGWNAAAKNGGSGGGGNSGNATFPAAGTGTAGQGSNGGVGLSTLVDGSTGGGGGGAGAVGAAGGVATTNGVGGVGVSNDITGTATFYGGGGGAGLYATGATTTARPGGNGGGGTGNSTSAAATAGTVNTGGGGGGAQGFASAAGGSGVVIIRFITQTRVYKALASYADNAAAIAGSLKLGQFYKNSTTGAVQQVT